MLLREVNFTAQNYNLAGTEKLTQVVIVHDKDHLKKQGIRPDHFRTNPLNITIAKKDQKKSITFQNTFD